MSSAKSRGETASWSTTWSIPAVPIAMPPTPLSNTVPAQSAHTSPTACSPAARSLGSRPPPIQMMTITDSILATEAVEKSAHIRQLSIARLLADAIRRTAEESSVSELFE